MNLLDLKFVEPEEEYPIVGLSGFFPFSLQGIVGSGAVLQSTIVPNQIYHNDGIDPALYNYMSTISYPQVKNNIGSGAVLQSTIVSNQIYHNDGIDPAMYNYMPTISYPQVKNNI
jgi:hypothetical protein